MIIEFSEADESRVRWSKDGKEWKSADLDDLIEAYEREYARNNECKYEYDMEKGTLQIQIPKLPPATVNELLDNIPTANAIKLSDHYEILMAEKAKSYNEGFMEGLVQHIRKMGKEK